MKKLSTTNACVNFMYFLSNYPKNFIEKIWDGKDVSIEHLNSKLNALFEKHGTLGVTKFFYELDRENQRVMIDWVTENYSTFSDLHLEEIEDADDERRYVIADITMEDVLKCFDRDKALEQIKEKFYNFVIDSNEQVKSKEHEFFNSLSSFDRNKLLDYMLQKSK